MKSDTHYGGPAKDGWGSIVTSLESDPVIPNPQPNPIPAGAIDLPWNTRIERYLSEGEEIDYAADVGAGKTTLSLFAIGLNNEADFDVMVIP